MQTPSLKGFLFGKTGAVHPVTVCLVPAFTPFHFPFRKEGASGTASERILLTAVLWVGSSHDSGPTLVNEPVLFLRRVDKLSHQRSGKPRPLHVCAHALACVHSRAPPCRRQCARQGLGRLALRCQPSAGGQGEEREPPHPAGPQPWVLTSQSI